MEKKCGNCQKKTMANMTSAPHSRRAAGGGPSQNARHGAGERAHKGADGMNLFQGSIGGEINAGGCKRQQRGQGIQGHAQIQSAAAHHQEAGDGGVHQAEASPWNGTLRGATHAAVGFPLHHFVKSGSSAGNQPDTEQRVKQAPRKGRDTRLQGPEIVSAPRGHDDQRGDPAAWSIRRNRGAA